MTICLHFRICKRFRYQNLKDCEKILESPRWTIRTIEYEKGLAFIINCSWRLNYSSAYLQKINAAYMSMNWNDVTEKSTFKLKYDMETYQVRSIMLFYVSVFLENHAIIFLIDYSSNASSAWCCCPKREGRTEKLCLSCNNHTEQKSESCNKLHKFRKTSIALLQEFSFWKEIIFFNNLWMKRMWSKKPNR